MSVCEGVVGVYVCLRCVGSVGSNVYVFLTVYCVLCIKVCVGVGDMSVGWLFEFYILATSNIISGRVPTCETATKCNVIVLPKWEIRPPAP